MKKVLTILMAAALVLSLASCGGGGKQNTAMADALMKASVEELTAAGHDKLYCRSFAFYTVDKATIVTLDLYYDMGGVVQREMAAGRFEGDSMTDFALGGPIPNENYTDSDKEIVTAEAYTAILSEMSGNEKVTYSDDKMMESLCETYSVGNYDQAKTDLGVK